MDPSISARLNHIYENGRRYHGFRSEFPLPNDQDEQSRHDAQNSIWRAILDSRLIATPVLPTGKNTKILDVGTRTGIWPSECQEEISGARVFGLDPNSTSMQIYLNQKQFVQQDLDAVGGWGFSRRQAFHFVHGQWLAGYVGDWEVFYGNAYGSLLPGGMMEVKEGDLRFYSDNEGFEIEREAPGLARWMELLEEAGGKFGKRLNVAGIQRDMMERAGFVDVKEEVFTVPIGTWSEDPKWQNVGSLQMYQMVRAKGVEAYSLRLFTGTLGWSKEQTDAFLSDVCRDLGNEALRLYSYFHLVTGKKPINSER